MPLSCRVFRTKQNKFGLFHIYNRQTPPSHDPVDPSSVTYAIPCLEGMIPRPHVDNSFHPYSNENSFLLGDWYWNHGGQKSRKSFQQLLEIIRSLDFHPEDVQDTKWLTIDCEMGNVGQERPEDSSGWNQSLFPFHFIIVVKTLVLKFTLSLTFIPILCDPSYTTTSQIQAIISNSIMNHTSYIGTPCTGPLQYGCMVNCLCHRAFLRHTNSCRHHLENLDVIYLAALWN